MKNYKVYLIREKESCDIKYVGLTSQSLYKRFSQHKLKRRITDQKYQIELVAEELSLEEAVQLEKLLIKQYDLLIKGWNVSPGSVNGYSNLHSDQLKEKWSRERRGVPVSEEHAEKNRLARLGRKNSPEHNKAISEKTAKAVICLETGKVYPSARAAAKELGVSYCKISLCCTGKRKTTRGLHFKFVETVETSRND